MKNTCSFEGTQSSAYNSYNCKELERSSNLTPCFIGEGSKVQKFKGLPKSTWLVVF